jgi:glycosyltransferase involved in cell wall biosynthesis
VVDNGSNPPVDPTLIAGLAGNFRLIRIDPAPPSPAHAINRGLAEAKGDIVGVMIDGARIVTPGLLHFARHASELYDRAVVVAPGWYLGADFQGAAITRGYDRDREDALLASINWPEDGYRLFEISTPGDVWKMLPCLKELRPDLDIFTIATPWTGLTVVTGLDPSSRVLKDGYDSAVAKFIDLPFSAIEGCMPTALNIVPNDWSLVEARLKARGIL